jgi:hypothetical protein
MTERTINLGSVFEIVSRDGNGRKLIVTSVEESGYFFAAEVFNSNTPEERLSLPGTEPDRLFTSEIEIWDINRMIDAYLRSWMNPDQKDREFLENTFKERLKNPSRVIS